MKAQLEKPEIMCGKIQAAVEKRLDNNFSIIARTEALIQKHGIDVAIERAHMYTEKGCDGFLIHSKSKEPDEIFEFAERYHKEGIKTPLVCVPTTYNKVSLSQLEDAGFSLCIYANYSVRAVVKSLQNMFNSIKSGNSLSAGNDDVVGMDTIFDLIRVDRMKESQNKYGS